MLPTVNRLGSSDTPRRSPRRRGSPALLKRTEQRGPSFRVGIKRHADFSGRSRRRSRPPASCARTVSPARTRSPTPTRSAVPAGRNRSIRDPNFITPIRSPARTVSPDRTRQTTRRTSAPVICRNTTVHVEASIHTSLRSFSVVASGL